MQYTASPRWLVSGAPRPSAPQLYCFAHGGGSAAEYLRWARTIPGAGLHCVQLPGRGSRAAEELPASLDTLVEAFVAQVPLGPGPFVFLGHSLGALVAYEVTRRLRDLGAPALPARLVVSGFPAPHMPRPHTELHTLPDAELLDAVSRRHGGIPQEVLDSPELQALTVPALRGDYRLLETYVWRESAPLELPVTVFGGREDRVTPEQLEAWRELTTGEVTVRRFPGGHFYLRERPAEVLRALAAEVRAARVPAGTGGAATEGASC
ncbi:thioesterase II family protein [Streptomyces vilmorinianum]|uniref:thioesterase II family protein n=1 Tax=Streptomyces vilmorinianum TaxID=3051092 RepID=UPI0010FB8757|nr:alpha/beta fold hydrolase [Streptomyces vilmorinianum]